MLMPAVAEAEEYAAEAHRSARLAWGAIAEKNSKSPISSADCHKNR